MPPVAGKQPLTRLVPKSTPVGAQLFEQCWTQHHVSVLASLAAANVNHHPLTVDVGHLQVRDLCPTCSCGVKRDDQDALKRRLSRIDQACNFLLTEDLRKVKHLLRVGSLGGAPASLQDLDVEEAQRSQPLRNGVRSQLPGTEHRNLILPNVIRAELVWRTMEMLSEMLDGADVSANGPRSVVAALQLFLHGRPGISARGVPTDAPSMRRERFRLAARTARALVSIRGIRGLRYTFAVEMS